LPLDCPISWLLLKRFTRYPKNLENIRYQEPYISLDKANLIETKRNQKKANKIIRSKKSSFLAIAWCFCTTTRFV
jgi:hypothetical protein